MAKTTFSGFSNIADGTTASEFWEIGGACRPDTDEDAQEIEFRAAGTLSNFYVYVRSNSLNASKTFRTRINNANGNQTFSVGASTTGAFEDVSNTDAIAAGDDLCFNTAAGGSSGTFDLDVITFVFDATTNTITEWCLASFVTLGSANLTRYNPVCGSMTVLKTDTTLENDIETEVQENGTWKNYTINITSNPRTTTSTFRNRINSANGSLVISVAAGNTGMFSDTTNTDAISAGDVVDYGFTTGSGTGSLRIDIVHSEVETTDRASINVTAFGNSGDAVADGTRYVTVPSGNAIRSADEEVGRHTMRFNAIWENLGVNVFANGSSTTSTIRSRINGANGNQSISIGAGVTGRLEDTTNQDTILVDDEIGYQFVAGATAGPSICVYSSTMMTFDSFTRSPTGTAEVASALTRIQTSNRSIAASAQSSTAVARIMTAPRSIAASAQSSAALARVLTANRSIAATAQSSAAVARVLTAMRSITENFTIDDLLARIRLVPRSIAATAEVASAAVAILTAMRSIAATAEVDSTLARLRTVPRSISESATVDAVILAGQLFEAIINETVEIAAVLARIRTALKTIGETFAIQG